MGQARDVDCGSGSIRKMDTGLGQTRGEVMGLGQVYRADPCSSRNSWPSPFGVGSNQPTHLKALEKEVGSGPPLKSCNSSKN